MVSSRLAPLGDASIRPLDPTSLDTWLCFGWWEGWRPVSFDGFGCPLEAQVQFLTDSRCHARLSPVLSDFRRGSTRLGGESCIRFPSARHPSNPPTHTPKKTAHQFLLPDADTSLSLAGLAQTERVPFAVPRQRPLARPRPPQIPPIRISPLQIETRPATTPSGLRDSPKTNFLASTSTPPSPPPPTYPTFSSQAGTQTRPTDRLRGAGVKPIPSTIFPRTLPYAGTRAAAPSSSVSRP